MRLLKPFVAIAVLAVIATAQAPAQAQQKQPNIVVIWGDPFESAPHASGMYVRWYADLLWLFVPIQEKIAEFGATLKEYPPVTGGSLSGGLNYKAVQIQNALDQLQSLSTSRN